MNTTTIRTFRLVTFQILLVALALRLGGCASSPAYVMLDRAVIQNDTGEPVANVTVRHEPTQRVGAVSTIPPGRALDLGLPRQPMRADHAFVSWTQDGRDHTVRLDLPQDRAAASSGRTMVLVYTLRPRGQVAVALEPELETP